MSTSNSKSVAGGQVTTPPAPTAGGAPASFTPKSSGSAPAASGALPVGAGKPAGQGESPRTAGSVRPELVGPRRIRLSVSRIDPWSAMKMSFLLSIALGIMMVVAAIVFWKVLDGMHVFTEVDAMVKEILGEKTTVNILQYVELSRVVSLATILAIVDVVLLTAIGTIGAFLYNVVAALVGGIHLTLTDD
ncbi:DUF3566 domain-containing protein [Timonella senegalensis]|uniref:DUF3566 domain-containing protein n=1 Tax=Timonella senegalensis TaxID=1465825 RepID=UPI001C4F5C00|nr:DUF3566 domain-containing protein [Timonella senegalensis]